MYILPLSSNVTELGSVKFHSTGSILYPGGSLKLEGLGGLPEFTRPLVIRGSGGGPLLTRGLSGICANALGAVNMESEIRRDVKVLEKKSVKAKESENRVVLALLRLNLLLSL